jgi:flagellar biosynthesis GTPase FlhF
MLFIIGPNISHISKDEVFFFKYETF